MKHDFIIRDRFGDVMERYVPPPPPRLSIPVQLLISGLIAGGIGYAIAWCVQ